MPGEYGTNLTTEDGATTERLLNTTPLVENVENGKLGTTTVISEKQNGTEKKQRKEVAIVETAKSQKWKLVPPDGGWGWLVLLGSTMVNVLVPGTVKSFGVLFVEFLEVFDASPAAAAWIPALCYFLYSSLGPVSSLLSLRYSYRTVTLLGGTFAAFGMIISFFATDVSFLYISYGVLVGTGAGLSFPPTVYIVHSYFLRLRGLANGLCISGSALGSIILPPILRVLLNEYGYRGAVLLMGAVTFNVWVAALFYHPVERHMKRVPRNDDETEHGDDAEEQDADQYGDRDLNEVQPLKPKFMITDDITNSSNGYLHRNDSFVENNDITKNSFIRSVSSAAVPNYRNSGYGRERKISVPASNLKTEMTRVRSGAAVITNVTSSSALNSVPEANSEVANMDGAQPYYTPSRLPSTRRRAPKRSPSTSSFQYITTPYHGSTLTLQPETFASSFSLRSITKNDATDKRKPAPLKFIDLSLLKDPLYLIILISNSTNAIGYTNFIILLPSYALALGYDKDTGAMLLSIVSALDLVGRIGGSALSDLPCLPKPVYFFGGLLVSGLALAVLPFASTFAWIASFCALFGLASGIYVGVTAVIMADMLGTDRLQSTYGISLFVNGILQLIGPPLCGIWLSGSSGRFTSLFCTLGVVLVVGASIWAFVPCILRKRKQQAHVEGLLDDA